MPREDERTLVLDILGFWHPGTGRGDGALADAAVHRTREGLPHLPGRTVKGLMRAAAALGAEAGLLTREEVNACFGSPPPATSADDRVMKLEEGRFTSDPGTLRFGSALLGADAASQQAWAHWAASNPKNTQPLYGRFASTRVGKAGVAEDATLRTIETVVPLTLHAPVRGGPDTPWAALDEAVRLFLRGLGGHRNRGLGRVDARLEVRP